MQLHDLQPGDILLTLGRSPLSAVIRWWLHGEYSHAMPVVENGLVLDMKWPRPELHDPHELSVKRWLHLRPTTELSPMTKDIWCATARSMLKRNQYDIASYLGWLTGTGSGSNRRTNCAEAVLRCCHNIGLFSQVENQHISPDSFYLLYQAGLLKKVE